MPATFGTILRTFGQQPSSTTPPATPVLTSADNADGTGAVVTISGADGGTTNTLYVAISGGAFASKGSTWVASEMALTLIVGIYYAFVRSVSDTGSTDSLVIRVPVTDATTRKIQFRVKNVIHIPGKSKKKLILEKVDKPIGYGP